MFTFLANQHTHTDTQLTQLSNIAIMLWNDIKLKQLNNDNTDRQYSSWQNLYNINRFSYRYVLIPKGHDSHEYAMWWGIKLDHSLSVCLSVCHSGFSGLYLCTYGTDFSVFEFGCSTLLSLRLATPRIWLCRVIGDFKLDLSVCVWVCLSIILDF